jgi:hypothetical protein
MSFADVNGDGRLDIVVRSPGNAVAILLGNADATFAAPLKFAAGSPGIPICADLNNDGRPDIVPTIFGAGNFSVVLADVPPTVFSIAAPSIQPAYRRCLSSGGRCIWLITKADA